jgi:metal-responsive CopG/Arc/MetJ family transcriptional regulator
MKTAISIPDSVFNAAELVAQKLNMSRSELYTKAMSTYLSKFQKSHITEALNEIYAEEDSAIDPSIHESQITSIGKESW